jgi:hypothetical protein
MIRLGVWRFRQGGRRRVLIIQSAEPANLGDQSSSEFFPMGPIGIQGRPNLDPNPGTNPLFLINDAHRKKGNFSSLRKSQVLLKPQDPFDEAVLSLAEGIGIVGTLGKKDDVFPPFEKPIDAPEGFKALDRLQSIYRNSSQQPDEMSNPGITEKLLFGYVVQRPGHGHSDNGNISPKLVFGEDDAGALSRDMIPPFHPKAIN